MKVGDKVHAVDSAGTSYKGVLKEMGDTVYTVRVKGSAGNANKYFNLPFHAHNVKPTSQEARKA